MKPNFALDLTHDGISLLFRANGGWALVGDLALDDPQMSEHLKELRARAEALGDGRITTKLIIPNSQILYATLEAPGPDDVAREVQIRVALEGMTPYSVSDLVFDWRAEGDVARVAVLAQETMEEAEGFAAQFGFNPVSFVARPGTGEFSGEPFFGRTRGAARILGANEKIVPDATPVPRNPRRLDPPSTPEPETAAPVDAAPEPTPEPLDPAPEPATPSAPPPSEPPATERPVLDAFPDEPETSDADTTETPKAPTAPRAARPSAKQRTTGTPPALAPFPPTPEDPSEISKTSTYRPVMRTEPKPAKPARPNGAAPLRATPDEAPGPSAPEAPAPRGPEPTAGEPAPSFSTRRAPAADPTSKPGTPEGPYPKVNFGAGARPATPKPSDIDDSEETGAKGADDKPAKQVLDDTAGGPRVLSGEAEARRQAMARALSRKEGDPEEPRESGLLSRVTTGLSGFSGSTASRFRRMPKDRPETQAPLAPPVEDPTVTPVMPEAPAPAPVSEPAPNAEKPKRGGLRKRKPQPQDDARSREAESMTVFGARQQASTRGRPRYMGLILTLVLLLLMAAAALWSTVFLDDEDVALFNPDPVTTPEPETPAADTTPTPEPEPEEPAADVLSPEEAEAQYAVTGVYQRAPDALGEPETARGDDVYIASIDPSVSPNDALALPDATGAALPPPEGAIPPPPPGTTFDLTDEGLVVPTPEGAVSPTGVVVTQGRPAVVPAPRPENLVPETQDDAALDLPPETPSITPRARPVDLAEQNERAQLGGQSIAELAVLRPRARPASLDTTKIDEVETAEANEATEEPGEVIANATELAVATSLRPGSRPSNFSAVVAEALQSARSQTQPSADNSDGSTVVAAAARSSQPIIPSSASVARTATMKNALNLRKLNLIGVYGSSSSRRALVRMGSGRYVKVSVGDRLDGGQVVAISDTRLVYQKGSKQYALDVLPLG
ncbi:hypothetical protein [Maritimibacter sp. UBA3975]|uniref:hypothetical protein n=1 Tax=Maritimibacter sp. UBA3975 TaxID=1946833 RepID=UPI000C092B79|nr:hypothetical protein [Maritimibacter sp. UBA3975]MAM61050.1 hypothetical protein [Maritimibacter sp.]